MNPARTPSTPSAGERVRRALSVVGLALLATAALLGLSSTPASASVSIDEVAQQLRQSPVYVEPGNEAGVSQNDADALVREVDTAGTPLFIAVISQASLGSTTIQNYLHQLAGVVGVPATYGVIAGRRFYADSELFSVTAIADQAVTDHRSEGATAILGGFINGVAQQAASSSGSDSTSGSGGSGALPWLLVGGAVVAGGVGVVTVASRRRRREQEAAALASVRTVIDEDVTEFGEQVSGIDVSDPTLDSAGRDDLATALTAYDRAKATADAMEHPQDAGRVTEALEDGRFALACVTARMAGQPLPERRAPCFFDPRHGPSVQDATWSPDGGTPREVPVCQACAVTLADGRRPAAREVPVGPGVERVPYWMAGPQYGPYAGGYYSAYGDLFPAMLIGTMLMPHTTVINNLGAPDGAGWAGGGGGPSDGWFGGGGGDFGGGGGGDFGGGFGGDGGGGGGGF